MQHDRSLLWLGIVRLDFAKAKARITAMYAWEYVI